MIVFSNGVTLELTIEEAKVISDFRMNTNFSKEEMLRIIDSITIAVNNKWNEIDVSDSDTIIKIHY